MLRHWEPMVVGSHAKTLGVNRTEGSVGKGLPWEGRAAIAGVDGEVWEVGSKSWEDDA